MTICSASPDPRTACVNWYSNSRLAWRCRSDAYSRYAMHENRADRERAAAPPRASTQSTVTATRPRHALNTAPTSATLTTARSCPRFTRFWWTQITTLTVTTLMVAAAAAAATAAIQSVGPRRIGPSPIKR